MWIVAIAWIYVVGLMALTEPNIVAGVMTFLGYCVLPLSILYYLTGSGRRKRKAVAAGTAAAVGTTTTAEAGDTSCGSDGGGSCGDGGGGGGGD